MRPAPPRRSLARSIAGAARLPQAAAAALTLLVAVAVAGQWLIPLPNAAGALAVPFRQFLPAALGVAAASVAPFPNGPLAAPRAYRVLLAQVGGFALAVAAGLALVGGPGGRDTALRTFAAAFGTALVSARWLGTDHGWVLPLAAVLLGSYFGSDATGAPRWFNLSAPQPDAGAAWALSAALLLAGVAALTLRPRWRRARRR